MKFRKKPVVIEAIQFNQNAQDVINFCGGKYGRSDKCFLNLDGELEIVTLEGRLTASHKDWIIKGVQGEFYPCKPDIFKQTYEQVSESESEEKTG